MQLTIKRSVTACDGTNEYCIFEYLFRDASNYKA